MDFNTFATITAGLSAIVLTTFAAMVKTNSIGALLLFKMIPYLIGSASAIVCLKMSGVI
jgi:hypothetical protein